MDRADRAGLGIAVAGHVLVFGALSLALISAPRPPLPTTPSVDIQIVDDVALKDQVPNPSPTPPAPSVAPEVGPPVEDTTPPEPVVAPAPTPAPTRAPSPRLVVRPKPAAAPQPLPHKAVAKPSPAKPTLKLALATPAATTPATARPHGVRLGSNFLKGIADHQSPSTAQAPRAPLGALATASIGRLVREQLKPHWKAPAGADAELLRTELSIALNPDGSVRDVHVIRTTGQTDSNRTQVKLHQEAAVKAVRLAAPFTLPPDLYDAWKLLEPVGFDKRLG